MSAWAQVIGSVTSPSNGKSYEVKWNDSGLDAYVSYAGWSYVGDAKTKGEALNLAITWLTRNS